jgi:hypothetical protein
MKKLITLALWILAMVFGYQIYKSVNAPIEFKKVKQERFQAIVNSLKDIRNSQEAYKTVNNKFAANFDELVNFVENGNFILIQKRDSSYMKFNRAYGIDMLEEVQIIDTLGTVAVKDSIFKNSNRYKTMMNVPFAKNGEKFKMESKIILKGGYKAAVFRAYIEKNTVLYDQPEDLVAKENSAVSVEEINGSIIQVGSINDVSLNGNWPPIYDKKQ